jgi:nucleoside-diphosphate-sugar epimerase
VKKAVLITGAAGQTGKQALLEYANGEKASYIVASDVTADFRIPASSNDVTYSVIRADLRKPKELQKITEVLKSRAEQEVLILDIGALFRYTANWRDLYEANVLGQKNLVEWVALLLRDFGKKVKLIFWSAAANYGEFNNPNVPLPAKEDYPLDPKSDYAKTKQIAEDLLLDYHRRDGLWVSIMRCGGIYAEGGNYGMGGAIIRSILGQLGPIPIGDGKNKVALVHARDTVRIADFLSTQEEANGEIFNVRDNSEYTLKDILNIQWAALGTTPFPHGLSERTFRKLIVEPTIEQSKEWEVRTTIDPEMAKMINLNSWLDIRKLKTLFEKAGESYERYLLYPDTQKGLTEVIKLYREELRRKEAD